MDVDSAESDDSARTPQPPTASTCTEEEKMQMGGNKPDLLASLPPPTAHSTHQETHVRQTFSDEFESSHNGQN